MISKTYAAISCFINTPHLLFVCQSESWCNPYSCHVMSRHIHCWRGLVDPCSCYGILITKEVLRTHVVMSWHIHWCKLWGKHNHLMSWHIHKCWRLGASSVWQNHLMSWHVHVPAGARSIIIQTIIISHPQWLHLAWTDQYVFTSRLNSFQRQGRELHMKSWHLDLAA